MSVFSADAYFYMGRDVYFGLNGRAYNVIKAKAIFDRALSMSDLSDRLREEIAWMVDPSGCPDESIVKCIQCLHFHAANNYKIYTNDSATIIENAAEVGYSTAQMLVAVNHLYIFYMHSKRNEYIETICMTGEPLGMFRYGKNNNKKQYIYRASEMGYCPAAYYVYDNDGVSDSLFNVLHLVHCYIETKELEIPYLKNVVRSLDFILLWREERLTYEAGALLCRYKTVCDMIKTECYDRTRIDTIMNYYTGCHIDTTRAIKAWLLFARYRLGFYSDLRRLVANAIWEMRYDWNEL